MAIVDFLVEHPIGKTIKENMASNEQVWQLFFYNALRMEPKGKMGCIISPLNHIILRAYSLIESYSNNVAK